MDDYTTEGLARVDRGRKAAWAVTNAGLLAGGVGVLAAVLLIANGFASADDSSGDAAVLIVSGLNVALGTVVVVAFFRGLAAIIELLAGHYELDLLDKMDEDE